MYYLFFLLLCHVAYSDMAKRKIKNISVLGIVLVGCGGIFLDDWFISSYFFALQSGVIVFIVALIFYVARVMAAGDVKLCAALSFCMGLQNFFDVWLISLLVLLVYGLMGRIAPKIFYKTADDILLKEIKGRPRLIPYGMVLSVSVVISQILKRL